MKKKIAFMAFIILLFTLVGYSTYAFLTAKATAYNVITAGDIDIELELKNKEIDENNDGMKAANNENTVMPGTAKEHELKVTNIGNNACYFRIRLSSKVNGKSTNNIINLSMSGVNWIQDGDLWYYKNILEPGHDISENNVPSILTVSFAESMGNEYQNATVDIYVTAEAVQAANNGFTTSVLEVVGWPNAPAPSPSDAG